MKFITDCLYLLTVLVISPRVVYRIIRHRRYRSGWQQRLGKITRKYPEKKCIWIHSVSVGEVNAARTIVKELQVKLPDFEILISTTTDTGFERANALFADKLQVTYFPLDFSRTVRRAFREIRPAICVLMELEVWPNFVQTAKQMNVPVVVVNGRLSEKSFSRYKLIKPITESIFRKLSLVLTQTNQYADRFRQLGCAPEKVIVTGSLKYDTAQIADMAEGANKLASKLKIDGRLWVAGGTGNDEEKMLLDVYQSLKQQEQFSDLHLAIVPRKPERFDEVAQLIQQVNLPLVRYSRLKKLPPENTEKPKNNAVILGDTMGNLRKFYSLATIIFVGRSLVPMGGSDMMEAAAVGKCTIFGPYAFNFKQTVDALLAGGGAIEVNDAEELLKKMKKCLLDTNFAQKIAENGRRIIIKNQGATARTVEQITKLLRP